MCSLFSWLDFEWCDLSIFYFFGGGTDIIQTVLQMYNGILWHAMKYRYKEGM